MLLDLLFSRGRRRLLYENYHDDGYYGRDHMIRYHSYSCDYDFSEHAVWFAFFVATITDIKRTGER